MVDKIPQPPLATIIRPTLPDKEEEKEILVNYRAVKMQQRAQLENVGQRVADLERALAAFSLILAEIPLSDKQKLALREDPKNKSLRAAVKSGGPIRIAFPTTEGRFSIVFEPADDS